MSSAARKRARANQREVLKQVRRSMRAPEPTEAPDPPSSGHPLGQHAAAYAAWQDHMKAGLLRIMEENKAALAACTRDEGCTSSVHDPHCLAVQ